jgi:peptidoglycan/xylan/chitin deacetylase (PgdA/CDA1 family)
VIATLIRAARGSLALRGATLALLLAGAFVPAVGAAGNGGTAPTPTTPTSTTPTSTTPASTTPASTTPPKPGKPRPQTLYRIVGCRSRGNSAYRHGPSLKEVAVGFDDGPAPDTPEFVTMLEKADVRATFFMIGREVSGSYRATLLRELRNGDVLGDHTFTHAELTRTANVRGQLAQTIGVIRQLSGYTPCVFRPPYGAYDQSIVETARSLGLATVLWNVDPSDWSLPGTSAIEQRVLAQVQPGSIIISHDGGGVRGETLAAYPHIFSALKRRGYRIVTIPELLGFRPVYMACIKLCDGIGLPRAKLPRGAITELAP